MSHEPESVVSPTTTTGPELTFTLAAINNEPAELDASSVVPPRNPRDERRGSRATDLDGMDAKDRAAREQRINERKTDPAVMADVPEFGKLPGPEELVQAGADHGSGDGDTHTNK